MKPKNEVKVQIEKPNIEMISVNIKGTSPLISHRWSEKAMKMMLDKQMKKANKGREIRNPEQEAEDSFYLNTRKEISFPALSIKQALVGAARNLEGVTMAQLRGAVFVMGDTSDGMIPVLVKGKSISVPQIKKSDPEWMRSDMVRVGMGTADIRFRGQVKDWSMKVKVKFFANVISTEQVINLLQVAGFSCGLGEWRPERNGDYGTFEIQK